jgi:hypothetical protein
MQSEVLANSFFCVKGSNEVNLKIIHSMDAEKMLARGVWEKIF